MREEETVCEHPSTGGERAVENLPVRITTPNTERTVQHPAVLGSYEICKPRGEYPVFDREVDDTGHVDKSGSK
jgi:hypothetical protein